MDAGPCSELLSLQHPLWLHSLCSSTSTPLTPALQAQRHQPQTLPVSLYAFPACPSKQTKQLYPKQGLMWFAIQVTLPPPILAGALMWLPDLLMLITVTSSTVFLS